MFELIFVKDTDIKWWSLENGEPELFTKTTIHKQGDRLVTELSFMGDDLCVDHEGYRSQALTSGFTTTENIPVRIRALNQGDDE